MSENQKRVAKALDQAAREAGYYSCAPDWPRRFARLQVEYLTALLDEKDRELEWVGALNKAAQDRHLALAARVVVLEGALQPFARESEEWNDETDDTFRPVVGEEGGVTDASFTVGDLRRARTALSPSPPAVEAVREGLRRVWCFVEPALDPETGTPIQDDQRYLVEWWWDFKERFPALAKKLER